MNGAIKSNNHVDFINLAKKKINYCLGCYGCLESKKCIQDDDFNPILEKALKADVIVFATPVYFYSMTGQLKVFIDRLVANYTKVRADIYIIVTAWDSNKTNLESTVEAIRGCTRDCFENCPEKGVIYAGGVVDKSDVKKRDDLLKLAYDAGLNC